MKYLHKPTGAIAIQNEVGYYVTEFNKTRAYIPPYVVESGNDWSLFKKALFLDENNLPIYENTQYWVVSTRYWNIEPRIAISDLDRVPDNYMRFSTKEAAEKYKEDNKPLYSKNELFKAFKEHYPYNETIIKGDFEGFLKNFS